MVGDNLTLCGREWKAFLDDSKYRDVLILHFIREEEDYYYVTAYNEEGYECNGYDLVLESYRERRCCRALEQVFQSPVNSKLYSVEYIYIIL